MRSFAGKVAFITGGCSGIGYALAEAFGRRGMKVMIADIDENKLVASVERLRAGQIVAEGVRCDVSDRMSMQAAALAVIAKFGKVHLVCNNAGVTVGSGWPIGTVTERDWNWVIDVNLKGVIHGTEVFAPLLESHGEGGHIVNTASMAALVAIPTREPYHATKAAVLMASEGWRAQLEARGIGVSVLMPGAVATQLFESAARRPERYGTRSYDSNKEQRYVDAISGGMSPAMVAERVVEAVEANELYIITHPEFRANFEARFRAILAAFDTAAKSRALEGHKPSDVSALTTALK
ncbi:MAG TPA: SDR family NAD(P)-dependent oxidoreductase, partial [Alphaproteobacteria bacterium]|nr:SDR family NAD(P)-dependent oxidoreductase [Alphaproteobacteria bacterium]